MLFFCSAFLFLILLSPAKQWCAVRCTARYMKLLGFYPVIVFEARWTEKVYGWSVCKLSYNEQSDVRLCKVLLYCMVLQFV